MPKSIGNVKLYMGPDMVGGKDNLLNPIIDFIDGAQKRLFIAVQELDYKPIAEAIIRAKQRKVLVKIVLESDYLIAKTALQQPFIAGGSHEPNRILHDAILRAKIKINSDFNPKIFHQKFIIRDGKSVLTGSTNFTETGISRNLNHIVVIHDESIAKIFNKEFKEIQQGHFGKLNEGHDAKPKEIQVSDIRIKTLFAPDHNPEMEIMKQIAKAKNRVDFAIFTFSKSSGIDDQLVLSHNAGITIRGAMFRSQANQKWSAKNTLKNAGLELYLVPKAGQYSNKPSKLHHKLMVIDKQVIIAGSFNYTGPANTTNDENILVIGDLDSIDENSIKKQKQLAKYALDEIERIINDFGEVVH
ncbi:phospholipase D-like domain-containing protein [Candidatus Neomarinimicrobiota bacterium]